MAYSLARSSPIALNPEIPLTPYTPESFSALHALGQPLPSQLLLTFNTPVSAALDPARRHEPQAFPLAIRDTDVGIRSVLGVSTNDERFPSESPHNPTAATCPRMCASLLSALSAHEGAARIFCGG